MAEPTIYTIPMDFYGGKNASPAQLGAGGIAAPVASPAPASAPSATQKPPEQKERQAKLPPQQTIVAPPVAPTSHNNKWIIGGIIAVVIILLAAGGFYFWKSQQTQETPAPAPVVVAPPVEEPVSPAEAPVEPAATSTAAVTPPIQIALIPAHNFKDSADSDGDGMTDIEEEMWGINPTLIDSDSDTYPDRLELLNLYNPSIATPARLMDSAIINTYINPTYKYTVYHPSAWVARAVDTESHQEVLFSALSGEFVQVAAFPFPTGKAFPDWFHERFPEEKLALYQPFVNRFKVSGIMSPDKTVAFITDGSNVFVLRYDGGTREDINYRSSFLMMVQSFKPAGIATPFELLPQTNLSAPTALGIIVTSTQEIIIPENQATSTDATTLVPLPFEATSTNP